MAKASNTIFRVYLAIVCALTLIGMLFITGNMINTTVNLWMPEPPYYEQYQYNPETKQQEKASLAEIEARQKLNQEREVYRAKKGMIKSATYLLLAGLVFGFHWRLFKREKLA